MILLTEELTEDANDEELDKIKLRYERLRLDSYSEYLLSQGRGSHKLMMEAESEVYDLYSDNEEEELDAHWLDKHLMQVPSS
jgi:hypothetical protein